MATETATAIEQRFALVAIGLIQESKTNPRKTFDAHGIDELAASIVEQGIIEPLIVRPMEEKDAPYELVAGARRLRAARKAKLEEVPCLIRELSDDAALEIQVIENLQRRDLHPLEEAEGYKALLKRPQYHVEAIAEKTGKSVSYVWQRIKLTDLIDQAKKAFLEDQITAGHAVQIARLQPADQKEALEICTTEEYLEGGASNKAGRFMLSVRDLTQWIRDNIHLSLDGAPWQKNDPDLVPKAGACDGCPKRAGNSPGLWPDITRAQTCTDRACFQQKLNAHLERAQKELAKDGKKVVKISDEWNPDKGVLGTHSWRSAAGKKACPKVVLGFYADGAKRGKTLDVCVDDQCKIHRPRAAAYNSSGRSNAAQADYEKQRQKEIVKERATERARLAILDAILEKTKSLSREDLETLGHSFNRLTYFSRWDELENAPKGNLVEENDFKKVSDSDLSRFLLAAALSDNLRFHDDADWLYEAAKRRKIDVKLIEKRALEGVIYDRAHKDRMQRWKGLKASGNTKFDAMTCQLCGREEKEQSKGGWHWIQKNDKNKVAKCSDCDRLERK